jgi:hypothetical protein
MCNKLVHEFCLEETMRKLATERARWGLGVIAFV